MAGKDSPPTNEKRTKAARIPAPPPFGVGHEWELRSQGTSMRHNFSACLETTTAPRKPIKIATQVLNIIINISLEN
jgi:hypothetical protein